MKTWKLAMMAALWSCIAIMDVRAGTIVKLGFSDDDMPDIRLVSGVLSTNPDGAGATLGDQNTEIAFLDALSSQPAIPNDFSSFTLLNVQLIGTPTTFGNTVLQRTSGGEFSIYDPNNQLLLAGTLGEGVLSGPLGGTATGGYLNTEFGNFTGGTLMSALGSMPKTTFSVGLTDVNNGAGISLVNNAIADFSADATASIGSVSTPEPAAVWILGICLLGFWSRARHRKS
jgi:hypothetical protein